MEHDHVSLVHGKIYHKWAMFHSYVKSPEGNRLIMFDPHVHHFECSFQRGSNNNKCSWAPNRIRGYKGCEGFVQLFSIPQPTVWNSLTFAIDMAILGYSILVPTGTPQWRAKYQ